MDFPVAYRSLFPAVFRYLHRLTGDPDLAEDLAQEAFVRLLERDLPESEARAWIFAVATNLARDHARTRRRRNRLLEANEVRTESPARPDEVVERAERIAAVRRALDSLSSRDRQMLLMREEGFSYREIAEAVGVLPGSVGTLIARALRRFGAAYTSRPPEGGADDASG